MDKISRILLFDDAEKALDMMEWPYSFVVLDKMGIGPAFQTWIKNLYKEQHASIGMEGIYSKKMQISQGVRQGCPLSTLLFALALEPFAINSWQNL